MRERPLLYLYIARWMYVFSRIWGKMGRKLSSTSCQFWVSTPQGTSIFDYDSDNHIKNINIIGNYKPNEAYDDVFSNKWLVVIQIIRLKLQNLFLNKICNYIAWMALLDEK